MKRIDLLIYKLAKYLVKHDFIRVTTEYDIFYYGIPVSEIIVDNKLSKHYDNLQVAVEKYKCLDFDVNFWELSFKSKESYAFFMGRVIIFSCD